MKTKRAIRLAAALLCAAWTGGAETRSTGTSERAYVLTHSAAIDGVCHDAARKELTVFFRTGTAYVYSGVSDEVFRDFIRADSQGRFYHERIRGHFASRRLTDGELVALVDRHDGRMNW